MRLAERRRDPVPRADRLQRLLADPEATADGVHRGRLVPDRRHRPPRRRRPPRSCSGRSKDIIVLPNGFNVYPEDIENALRVAGIRDSVVLETQPGRIEAVVLARARGEAATPRDAGRARHRCRRQGRQRHARPEPADRRLAPLARGGLPADPHAQDQARAGAGWVAADAPLPVGDGRRQHHRRLWHASGPRRDVFVSVNRSIWRCESLGDLISTCGSVRYVRGGTA